MADIGYVSLFLALVASIYTAVAYTFGFKGKSPALMSSARNGLIAVCGLVSISVITLLQALLSHNFQLEYVAYYSSRSQSVIYNIAALWAGNDGSLLFWAWILSIFALVVILRKRVLGKGLVPYAAAILMATEAFFLILLLAVSDPFTRLAFIPADGMGLNPMLENPGMILHPPALLAGYVGLSVPFAFAMAALLTRRLGDEWILTVRRWMIFAWLLLGIGNLIGSWWAYVELGWGGYWAWDPVENAGLMPWLVATAFLHSTLMQRRRGILKVWNMVLIIFAFVLAIFGTFLTRSGILSSVHTFSESTLVPFFLAFIGIALFGSLGLLYLRSQDLKSEAEMESLVSRESTFLINNFLLVGATFVIFMGTVFPAISEVVRGVKITVGAAFFNQVNGPIFLAIIFLAGICTLIGWRRASVKGLLRNSLGPLAAALVLILALFLAGTRGGYALVALFVCGFVIFTILSEWFRGVRARHRVKTENYLRTFFNLIGANHPRYGGYIVHIAIVLIAVGVIGSSFFSVEKEATLKRGESMTINQYTLTYNNIDSSDTQNRLIETASVSAYNGGELVGVMLPAKYFDRNREQPVSEVAIRSTPLEDLYVIYVASDQDNAYFKVLVNPMVSWIWVGGVVLVLGGLIAFWPARRRLQGK